jgi:polyhydroxyalkanoate synthesis regulator phasin
MEGYTEGRTGFMDDLKGLFGMGQEYEDLTESEVRYQRRVFDRQIEKFLDQHFSDYVHEFGLVDEVTLDLRTEKVGVLEKRSAELVSMSRELDGKVNALEERVTALEKKRKKR